MESLKQVGVGASPNEGEDVFFFEEID